MKGNKGRKVRVKSETSVTKKNRLQKQKRKISLLIFLFFSHIYL